MSIKNFAIRSTRSDEHVDPPVTKLPESFWIPHGTRRKRRLIGGGAKRLVSRCTSAKFGLSGQLPTGSDRYGGDGFRGMKQLSPPPQSTHTSRKMSWTMGVLLVWPTVQYQLRKRFHEILDTLSRKVGYHCQTLETVILRIRTRLCKVCHVTSEMNQLIKKSWVI